MLQWMPYLDSSSLRKERNIKHDLKTTTPKWFFWLDYTPGWVLYSTQWTSNHFTSGLCLLENKSLTSISINDDNLNKNQKINKHVKTTNIAGKQKHACKVHTGLSKWNSRPLPGFINYFAWHSICDPLWHLLIIAYALWNTIQKVCMRHSKMHQIHTKRHYWLTWSTRNPVPGHYNNLLPGCLDSLPGGWQLDENSLLAHRSSLVQLDQLFGLLHHGLFVKRQPVHRIKKNSPETKFCLTFCLPCLADISISYCYTSSLIAMSGKYLHQKRLLLHITQCK